MRDRYRVSLTKACALFHMSRSLYGYRSVARDSSALLARIKEIAASRVHYGYRRVHVMLQREGWRDNHKRVYRLYRAEVCRCGISAPSATSRRGYASPRASSRPSTKSGAWTLYPTRYSTAGACAHLTVVDNYTRECLAIEVGQSLKGEDVVRVLNAVVAQRGSPQTIKVDNGSEFVSKAMYRWAYEHGVELDFSRPGTPPDNAKVESFNGRFRQECLNEHWFLSLEDARGKIADWQRYYNESRPHSALQWAAPAEFAHQATKNASTDDSTTPEISTSGRY